MIPQRRRGVRLCAHGQNDQENRSILLQNFLKRRCPNLKLNDIIRHVCEFACDRDGSEFIESQWTTEQNNFFIFAEMQPNLLMLMKDQFANNIMQKIIEIGNKEQCQWILEIVKSHLMDLGSHKYGCHVVQRAIEYDLKNYNQEHSILHQFYGKNIVALAQDKYGSYVVQFLFRSISDPTLQINLYIHLHPYVWGLSVDVHGCHVIQCILKHGIDELIRMNVLNQIEPHLLEMVEHQCGNYVIQCAIEFCPPLEQNRLIDFVLRDVIYMSGHKYPSYVVEKCICCATALQREQAMNLICSLEPQWLERFCLGQFSNYVLRKLIEVVNINHIHLLYIKLEPYFITMARHVCGRSIINGMEGRLHGLNVAVIEHFSQLNLA